MEKKEKEKKKKPSKYVFTLKNIDIEKIDEKYGIIDKKLDSGVNITKLTELSELEKSNNTISFLDESKRLYNCNISMIDINSSKEINSESSNKYNCFWCRHFFTNQPIGCPISYISNKITKSYFSEISKENYSIKENITKSKLIKYNNTVKNKNIPFIFTSLKDKTYSNFNINKERDYYDIDGIFCSFNCCKAYIKDNKHNILYEKSDILLTKLYNDIINNDKTKAKDDIKNIEINPAPHWRLLIEYGGNLDINKFRENFTKNSYDFHGILRPCSYLYEEKFTFS
jgi:hypothetical protein